MEEKLKQLFYFPIIKYLSAFAALRLLLIRKKIIAITGSTGKTSTVTLMNTLLQEAKVQFQFADHINSAIGIPLYILGFSSTDINDKRTKYMQWIKIILLTPLKPFLLFFKKDPSQYILFEEDSDRPGEMRNSASLLAADIVIWLNTGITHAEYHDAIVSKKKFDSIIDSIGYEFAQSIMHMKKNGIAILNIDDPQVRKYRNYAKGNIITFGKESKHVQLLSYDMQNTSTIFNLHIDKEKIKKDVWMYPIDITALNSWESSVQLTLNNFLLPEYFYYTFASAIIFSILYNIPYGVFMAAIEKYQLPPGRMSLFEGLKNTHIIDSTYNASQSAIEGSLDLLAEYENNVAILGDMRELGEETKEEHEKIAQKIIKSNIDKIILVGEYMSTYTYDYLQKNGYQNAIAFSTTKDLKNHLIQTRFTDIPEKSIILIKGSQNNIFLESIVELLLKDKQQSAFLCRRGAIWEERRVRAGI